MNDEISKAIELSELKNDLVSLQNQAQAISGAIQYIQQKIAALNKPDEVKEDENT